MNNVYLVDRGRTPNQKSNLRPIFAVSNGVLTVQKVKKLAACRFRIKNACTKHVLSARALSSCLSR